MEKRTGTRPWSLIIVTMLLTGAFFAISSDPVSSLQDGAYSYSVGSNVATITAYTGAGGAITIPDTLGGYPVEGIGAHSFNNAAGALATSIVIPNGVKSIGDYAFTGCTYITSLTFGNGIVSIGTGAFEQCSSITSVSIPDKVTTIRSYTFYSCTALASVTMGKGVANIGDNAFYGCSSLTSLTIPQNVTTIGMSAFEGCSSLTSLTIPDKVLSVGTFAFFGCSALTTVTMGSGVVSLGSSAFYSCDALTTINFLGLVAPTSVGFSWVADNPSMLNGHAYAASNFPSYGNTFYGLLMDSNLDQVAPGPPTNLLATSGNSQVALTWSDPYSIGGDPISDFRIYRGTSSGAETYLVNTGSGLVATYTDTGLTNGQTYYYQVSAVNSFGEGPLCTEVPGIPLYILSAPRDLQTAAGSGQVSLSWIVPSSDGGSAIDYYIVYQDTVDVQHLTGTSTNITGLTNGHTYYFAVAAHNAVGTGPLTPWVLATPNPVATVPTAPTGLAAVPGDGQIALSWNRPASNGGAPIDYCLVYIDGVVGSGHLLTNYATITGLTNGRSYVFTVAHHNSVGIGAQSAPLTATPIHPITIPGVPTGITATPGDGQIELSWSAPVSNGGAAIDHYLVYINGVVRSEQYPTNSVTITGLTNGQSYVFTVAAHNSAGTSPQSAAVNAMPSPSLTVPGVPTGITATPGDGQIELSWSAPGSNGGATIDHYLVYINGVVGSEQYTAYSVNITGLTNGQQYSFTVAAHNSVGIGPQSAMVTVTPSPTITVPGVPNGLAAMPGDAQISLSWMVPNSNGGATIEYYIVYQDEIDIAHPTTTSIAITGLSDGRSYIFTVAAQNSVGTGPKTSGISATPNPEATVPGMPTGLIAAPGDAQASLSWTSPESNGGSTIDYYVVYQNGVTIANLTETSISIKLLTNGQEYNFTIAAHNAVGTGYGSSPISVTPSLSVILPEVPKNLQTVADDGQVMISWQAPGNNGGSMIDYYVIYQDGIDIRHEITTSMVVTGLTNGQQYGFAVSAHNSVGTGARTSAVTATPGLNAMLPGIPTNLIASHGDGLITLSWAAPLSSGSSYVDHYVIYQDGVDVGHTSGISTTIDGLVNERRYSFAVAAHNSEGIGTQSSSLSISPSVASSTDIATISQGNDGMVMNFSALMFLGAVIIAAVLLFGSRKKKR